VTLDGVRIDGATSSLVVAVDFGPRIAGLIVGDRNLFASLPQDTLDTPFGRPYRLRGGHRLWVAPEEPAVTYQPDDEPCAVTSVGDGLLVEASPDGAGIAKSIAIVPTDDGWIVDHVVTNHGSAPITVAPWAITQFRPGGRVTLALGRAGEGLQADRALVLWPYTDLGDPRLSFVDDRVMVDASAAGPAMKVGVAGSDGVGEYELDGVRVRKRITIDATAAYADRGAAVQTYVHERFCELETLGPLVELAPGDTTAHREAWIVS